MTRILYFDWHSAGTEFYRTLPLDYIDEVDLKITRSNETNITFATLNKFDAIIICRPSSAASLQLIKLAKDMDKYVIADFDDDCLHIDEYNPMYEVYQLEKANVLECLALSNEVWVSTQAIKQSFRLYNKNVVVIPNAHNDTLFPVEQKRPFTYNKIATWRGGESHCGDIYDIGVPERIIQIVNSNEDWRFIFHGQRFKYLEKRCGANYIASGGASTIQFHKMMHEQNACVFLYPLADTLFNRSKSNASWLEATYAGSAYYGNTNLPEFIDGTILGFNTLLEHNEDILWFYNRVSWEFICDNLLLSKVNQLRIERLRNI